MAPVEPDASAHSNVGPYALFSSRVSLVIGLTVSILITARRAAKSLPPSTTTRSQQPLRRNYAILFSVLAFLSLASVTTFAVIWRAISYIQWADQGRHESPNSLWRGWYGADEARWHLGDWVADIDLGWESDLVAVLTPEGFLYTSQHYAGLLASAIFMGVEGHRRNLEASTIASFVLLSATGSLGYALNLFFVTILYTPLTMHKDDTPLHDALFAPSPAVYYAPITLSLLFLNWLPDLLAIKHVPRSVRVLRLGYTAVPLFLAFAPKIMPLYLGRQHTSKAAAHRSYAKVFHFLAMASFVLYWRQFAETVSSNQQTTHHHWHVWDVFTNTVWAVQEESKTNKLLQSISTTGQRLKQISKHPAISVTSLDVLFTMISLFAWAFTRNLDVDAILENSILSFLVPKHEKHVAFEDEARRLADLQPEPESPVEAITPKKRGRPPKNKTAVNGTSAPSTASVRRSLKKKTRGADHDSDDEPTTHAESAYEPTSATKRDVAETEADGVTTAADPVHGGESTALTLFLAFVGGLGQVAAGALGAEVTRPQE